MKYSIYFGVGTVIVTLISVFFLNTAIAGNQSVTVCHVPPGNPSNAHEIVISEKAVDKHLRKHPGDKVGPCPSTCVNPSDCDDANPCTIDRCNPDGTCDWSQLVDCDDLDPCTINGCDPSLGCVSVPVPDNPSVPCDDGNPCTTLDVCSGGVCSGTDVPGCCTNESDCPPSDECTVRYCDDTSGSCREVDISSRCAAYAGPCEVAFCDPLSGCGVVEVTCPDDGDICTVAVCNPYICGDAGACETLPNPNPPEQGGELTCDDGLDNDCDGLIDCDDANCAQNPACGGSVCPQDEYEPNETKEDAYDLGTLVDMPVSIMVLNGTLDSGAGDSDWYTFYAEDVPEGNNNADSFLVNINSINSSSSGLSLVAYKGGCPGSGTPTLVCSGMGSNCTYYPPFDLDEYNDSDTYCIGVTSSSVSLNECAHYSIKIQVGFACGEGQDNCSTFSCIDLTSNPNNCGACGITCNQGQPCCDGVCAELLSDPDNCGACGNACGEGQGCCGGVCMDVLSDPDNCGTCGYTCSEGTTCCNGVCVDLLYDHDNCGSCGNFCCNNSCGVERDCCDGVCVDLLYDNDNCGACGNACSEGMNCRPNPFGEGGVCMAF